MVFMSSQPDLPNFRLSASFTLTESCKDILVYIISSMHAAKFASDYFQNGGFRFRNGKVFFHILYRLSEIFSDVGPESCSLTPSCRFGFPLRNCHRLCSTSQWKEMFARRLANRLNAHRATSFGSPMLC